MTWIEMRIRGMRGIVAQYEWPDKADFGTALSAADISLHAVHGALANCHNQPDGQRFTITIMRQTGKDDDIGA
jgi:hypothetical protein